jgi:probable rRNA maturation factor
MLEVEVFGAQLLSPPLPQCEVERLCTLALASAGVHDGHIAVEFVDAGRIGDLNAEHRGKHGPTDVLSFPIDGAEPHGVESSGTDPSGVESSGADPSGVESNGEGLDDGEPNDGRPSADAASPTGGRAPRELGDIVICPEHTVDLREAIVHGVLHLVGMDHEIDDGQMLAVQTEILRWGAS